MENLIEPGKRVACKGGKSGHQVPECWVIPRSRKATESATENTRPKGKGEKVG